MSDLSTLPKGDSAWLFRKAIERIMQQVSVLETNIGSSTTGNSANTQIIFNDDGTLRGDAGLVYNKTTDALTVAGLVTAGSATITGDLTVDTSTLKVDSTNNRVGILTATPADTLDVNGRVTALRYLSSSSSASLPSYAVTAGNGIYNSGANQVGFAINSANAMTLNSTGLGVGVSPSYKLEVVAPAGDNIVSLFRSGDATAENNAGGGFRSISSATAASRVAQVWLDADGANFGGGDYFFIQKNGNSGTVEFNQFSNAAMIFSTNGTERLRIDSSGNVGVGVTPTNLAGQTRVEIKGSGSGNLTLRTASSNAAARDWQIACNLDAFGELNFRQGASQGAEPNSGTTRMVLDASGNLILLSSNTPATLTTNGQLTVNATSNTNLRFSYRGSDGTTRVANITLA